MRIFFSAFLLAAFAVTLNAQIKKPSPPTREPLFANSLQAFVVTTSDWDSAKGTARLFERRYLGSDWKQIGDEFPVVVGRNGLAIDRSEPWREDNGGATKKEGDGRAPAGIIPLTFAFGRPEKTAEIRLPYTRIEQFTECVDDVDSTHYNTIVDRMKVGNFDWKSSEKMLEVGDQYDLGVFVAYNSYPVVRGSGSCIFLHIWKDAETGTAGCTAMAREDLERVVNWLDPKKDPHLVQMPVGTYRKYRNTWHLPKLN